MTRPQSLDDFKALVQATLEKNEDSLQAFGKTPSAQLKGYLIETNHPSIDSAGCPAGEWEPLGAPSWYVNKDPKHGRSLFADVSTGRVWRIYSLLDATTSDGFIDSWVRETSGLDHCWLSRNLLLRYEKAQNWQRRGLGLRYVDTLSPEEEAGYFSLKAWLRASEYLPALSEVLKIAEEKFAIYSVRWQKISNGSVSISGEWYSNGKVTINRGVDVDEVLTFISQMAVHYDRELHKVTKMRDQSMAAFEISFSQKPNLDRFADVTAGGTGETGMWLTELEKSAGLRRFKGVDLHTWDRIFLDISEEFAHLVIPKKGCINAAPRFAVAQGENNLGKTTILYDGVEVFV
ncbi:MAG: hypothetical protein QXT68_07290 [Halobacteria archaeon]